MPTDPAGAGWAGGVPDERTLERLANELFSAAPGGQAPVWPPPVDVPAVPDGPPRSIPPVLEGVSNQLVSDTPLAGTAPQAIEMPFYFLQDAVANPARLGRDVDAGYYFLEFARLVPGATGVPGVSFDSVPALPAAPAFDVHAIRRDFPILRETVNGRPLVWLDNAATTQKPQSVIDRLAYFYQHENSNVHRAAHALAARSTDAYEAARDKVRGFLNASSPDEIVFLRGATEAINLVAHAWGRQHVGNGDEIVVSWLEHHANIVPWMQLVEQTGATLKVIPVDDSGQILVSEYAKLLGPKTKIVAFAHVSNALGTVTPARQMIQMAHAVGAKVLLDGAQAVSHLRVDVQALDPDWYVFSGHKVFAPTGIGALYGKEAVLDEMAPWQGGGSMIKDVTFEHVEYQRAPSKFEAGTGNIADAVGLGAAIDYLSRIGLPAIEAYEHELLVYATRLLRDIPGLTLFGTAPQKAGVLSFLLEGCAPEDVGGALNQEGIAVRAGHHCAQPILRRFGVEKTVRASLALYNTVADVDALVGVLSRLAGRSAPRVTGPASGLQMA